MSLLNSLSSQCETRIRSLHQGLHERALARIELTRRQRAAAPPTNANGEDGAAEEPATERRNSEVGASRLQLTPRLVAGRTGCEDTSGVDTELPTGGQRRLSEQKDATSLSETYL